MIEEHNNVGLLDDKFDASQVNNLFKEKFNNDKLKLIVIAACHSEKIAEEIKKKVGKTIVIAIKRTNAVLDSAATSFAKEFYGKISAGSSPREAFECAQKSIRLHYRTLSCCCHH